MLGWNNRTTASKPASLTMQTGSAASRFRRGPFLKREKERVIQQETETGLISDWFLVFGKNFAK